MLTEFFLPHVMTLELNFDILYFRLQTALATGFFFILFSFVHINLFIPLFLTFLNYFVSVSFGFNTK